MLSACSYVYADKFTACCSKCQPPERTHALSRTRHCMVNGCVDDVLFNAAPNRHTNRQITFLIDIKLLKLNIIAPY